VKAEKWIVIGAELIGWRLAGDGAVKHSAGAEAIDGAAFGTETDKAAGKHIHDHRDPVAVEEGRLAAEQVDGL